MKVTVYIGSRNKKTFTTGTDGTYVITLSAGGRYNVTYSKRGYHSQSLSVLVTQGAATTQDVALVKF